MNTVYFSTGSKAILKALTTLGLKRNDLIIVPDYYCEDISNKLSLKFKLESYKVNNNLKPTIKSLKFLITKKPKLIILVQYFNEKIDLNRLVEYIQKRDIKVLVDLVHLFPKKGLRLYKKADAEIYSIRKSLYLNNGSIAYVNGSLLNTKVKMNSLNLKSNFISSLKIIRFIWTISNLPIHYGIYKKRYDNKSQKSYSFENDNTADIVSIIFCFIIQRFNIINFINLISLQKNSKRKIIKNINYLSFCEQLNINRNSVYIKKESFKWPVPINGVRSLSWTKNSQKLYEKNHLYSLYF